MLSWDQKCLVVGLTFSKNLKRVYRSAYYRVINTQLLECKKKTTLNF